MSTRWADDFDVIRKRRAEIIEEEKPRCPQAPGTKLYDCLRSQARCQTSCPHYNEWIGPQNG